MKSFLKIRGFRYENLHHSEPAEVIMSERHKLSTKAYTLVP